MDHPRTLQAIAIAAYSVLVPFGSGYLIDGATGDASEANSVVVETDDASCEGTGDVFQLDVPGTYVAFTVHPSGSLLTEVRGSDNELLATSHPTTATTAPVDVPSGHRFGVAAPQVFQVVESGVTIHVNHDHSPYELVLVRIDGTAEFSRLNVRPPVEHIINKPSPCPTGDFPDMFKVHTDAVYSNPTARQIFLIESPNNSSTESPSSGSGDQQYGWWRTWPSPATASALWTSRFFGVG